MSGGWLENSILVKQTLPKKTGPENSDPKIDQRGTTGGGSRRGLGLPARTADTQSHRKNAIALRDLTVVRFILVMTPQTAMAQVNGYLAENLKIFLVLSPHGVILETVVLEGPHPGFLAPRSSHCLVFRKL
jgi:hypothetical protein